MKKMILVFMALLVLMSCQSEVVENEDKEIIPFRITWKTYSSRGETIAKIVNVFNKGQVKYEIELTGGNEDLNEIETSLVNDSADIYVLPYRYVQLLGQQGQLKSFEFNTAEKQIEGELIKLGIVDHKTYGIPWVCHSMALIYNKSLLDSIDINIEDIQDRNTFITVLEKIEAETDSRGIGLVGAEHNDLSWMVNQFIYGNNGQIVSDGEIRINSEEAAKGLDFYMNTLSKYAQDTWQDDTGVEVMNYFRDGDIAFEIQGLWGVTDIWKNGDPFEVGVLPLSVIEANAEIGPMMLGYDQDISGEKEIIIQEFIDFMTSKEAQEMIMNGEYSPEHDKYYPFRLPVRNDIITSASFEPYRDFSVFIESYAFPSIDVPIPAWMIVKQDVYTPYLHRVVMGEMTIEELLEMTEIEGSLIMEDF